MAKRARNADIVLCATDLSGAGDEALRQGHEAARALKGRLVVLHVLPDPLRHHPILPLGRKPRYTGLPEAHEQATDAMRAQLDRALGSDAAADLQIEHGIPHAAIIECAEAVHASLIVVGASPSHVGHEAERVVRYAHCPVLVARPRAGAGGVLVATDLSDAALPAVAAGVAEARRRRSPLALLHVVDMRPLMAQPDFNATAVPLTNALRRSLLGAARARLQKALGRFRAPGDLLVESGEPVGAILDKAERRHCSLLVLGTAGATGLKRMVLGSVAEAVLRRAPCSTLVVRLHVPHRK